MYLETVPLSGEEQSEFEEYGIDEFDIAWVNLRDDSGLDELHSDFTATTNQGEEFSTLQGSSQDEALMTSNDTFSMDISD